jgi:hypothetical protein
VCHLKTTVDAQPWRTGGSAALLTGTLRQRPVLALGKPPRSTAGKKPPAPSVRRRPAAIGPMTLGNMRSLGPRSLDVTCKACGHHIIEGS